MKNVEVRLSHPELYIGSQVGTMRRTASMQNGNDKNKHAHKSDWLTDIHGACAEMAASKYLGIYWEPRVATRRNPTYKDPDLCNGMEVRATAHPQGHLIIRPNDVFERTFILVICEPPIFRLVGTLIGIEARCDSYFHRGFDDEADCWWVPQDMLADLPPQARLWEAAA